MASTVKREWGWKRVCARKAGIHSVSSGVAGSGVLSPFECIWQHPSARLPSIRMWAVQYSFMRLDQALGILMGPHKGLAWSVTVNSFLELGFMHVFI